MIDSMTLTESKNGNHWELSIYVANGRKGEGRTHLGMTLPKGASMADIAAEAACLHEDAFHRAHFDIQARCDGRRPHAEVRHEHA